MPPVSFDAKEALVVAQTLAAVANADGGLTSREQAFLTSFGYLHGVDPEAIVPKFDENALAVTIRLPDKRREVVSLCLAMALSDRDFAPEEDDAIKKVAHALGVTDAELVLLTISARTARR